MSEEHFPRANWLPLLAGISWLLSIGDGGLYGFVVAVLPGALLLGGGVATFLLPGDLRTQQITAAGGVIGALAFLPAVFAAGPGLSLVLLALSAASFVAAGHIAHGYEPAYDDVPDPPLTLKLAAKVALDEAVMATLLVTQTPPDRAQRHAGVEELKRAERVFRERAWLEKPETFHVDPPELADPELVAARSRGFDYEHMRFESGYEPHPDVPGRERWLGYEPNRTAHAWVLRHAGEPRPWLVCIHGYSMGRPAIDIPAFQPKLLHQEFGLNLVLPVLPLHGPRAIARRSGAGFLNLSYLNTVHAEAQAMWDVRRILSWVRAQDAPKVGAYGLSLGGYTTALLAGLDADLACAIAGIPATDFARLNRRFATPMLLREAEAIGLSWDDIESVLRVVSPLALAPQVPHERRYIFGGSADRLVPPDQVRDLWAHWGEPRIIWYAGSHLSFNWEPEVRVLLRDAVRESLLEPSASAD
jgi:hypothetical protein